MTNQELLKPQAVFDCFAQICQVPRPSKKEGKMIAFLKAFGENLGLMTLVDETGNVLIRKPATPGLEHLPTIILQSHMDMVCEKEAGLDFDFETQPIETYIDGEWLTAKGTTLGADDGIGVAMELAILQSQDVKHGPLECVFTVDEETGLTGAEGMKPGFMTGRYLINLDSEDEGQIFISCAGGANTEALFPWTEHFVPAGFVALGVSVSGLTGGHSGDDINKRRANANKLLVRLLHDTSLKTDLRLLDIQSGGLHNAIPRDGRAVIAIPGSYKEQFVADANVFLAEVREEFAATEPGIAISVESEQMHPTSQDKAQTARMLAALRAVHNGVLEMDQDLNWLVQTSSNLASIRHTPEGVRVVTSQRSNVMSARKNMSATVAAALQLGGATTKTADGYPGWKLDPNSKLLKAARESYVRLFHKEPKVLAIHAGLECGLLSEKYPEIDMVSFGPTLRGVHSPDERLHIPTVQMVWDHLLDLLVNIE
ncbi:MAG: aminoacyl-histidine dipeptidase [Bacteroidaceae bacterium]|nr:aminoacyl-histidine dipeptidase [Bacteroidaceae bacterium]